MKEGRFAVALIANQDKGFAKFIAAVHTIAHHFFQQGQNQRLIAQRAAVITQPLIGCAGHGQTGDQGLIGTRLVAHLLQGNRQLHQRQTGARIAAAFEQVDSTPMEGFDPNALDEILDLRARGLRSVAIVPLGYRADEGDWLVNLKKVRRPREQFVTEV